MPIRLQIQTDKSYINTPIDPIKSRADMPVNQPYNKPRADIHTNLNQKDTMPICIRINPMTRLCTDLPTEPTLRWHRTAIYY